MLVSCERCSTTYVLEDALVPAGGVAVQCTRCAHVFRAQRALAPPPPAVEVRDPRLAPPGLRRNDVMLFGPAPARPQPGPGPATQRMVFGLPDPTQPPAEIYRSAEGRHVFGMPPAFEVLASSETAAPFELRPEAPDAPASLKAAAPVAASPAQPTARARPTPRARPPVGPTDDVVATALEPHRRELLPAGELAWPRIATHVPGSEQSLRSLGRLPAPFLPVHAVEAVGPGARVVSDRFVGVTLARAAQLLKGSRRQLPLEVWLRLADRWLAFLGELSPQHLLWMTWVGPHSLGLDVSGRLVIFATRGGSPVPAWSSQPQGGGLHSEWLDLRPGAQASASVPLGSVCKALIWLLDPHPFEHLDALPLEPPQPARPWDGRWSHRQVPQALADVLNGWLERPPVHDGTIARLRAELLSAAGVPPASDERVTSILVSAAQRDFAALAGALAHETTTLPRAWRDGGLWVAIDQLLERAAPLGECPLEAGAIAAPELAAFVVVPTRELQLVVTDAKGEVVHRTSIGRGADRMRVGLPLATRCTKDSRFTVTVTHPGLPEAPIALEALSDPRGWVELQPGPKQDALEHLWSSLREAEDGEGFQVPRLAPAPARTPPPRQSRYEHYVDTHQGRPRRTVREWADGATLGCLVLVPLAGLLSLPVAALCWFGVLPWRAIAWLFGGAVVLAMLGGLLRPSDSED